MGEKKRSLVCLYFHKLFQIWKKTFLIFVPQRLRGQFKTWNSLVWTKVSPPKRLPDFFLLQNASTDLHWKKRNFVFCKILILKASQWKWFKPLVWFYTKRCIGKERTRASTTFHEVIWCIVPETAGDELFFGKLVKRKDNAIMKGEKHCQNKDKVWIDFHFNRNFCENLLIMGWKTHN